MDNDPYDLILLDKVSGSVDFKNRPKGKEVTNLVNNGKVETLVIEEFSRIGRNTGDVLKTLEWLEDNQVNVVVRNIGLQSRPNGQKNPIWKIISSVMSSLYEMELENILERTTVGRQVFVQNGGILGRPVGSTESEKDFLNKKSSRKVIKSLKKGFTIREASKVASVSTRTTMKVKKTAIKHGILEE